MAAKRRENGKTPGNSRDCKNWHGLCDAVCIGKGRCPQPKGKKKMDRTTTNLLPRRDPLFVICKAVGQYFGFNSLPRPPEFIAAPFFFPDNTFPPSFRLGPLH